MPKKILKVFFSFLIVILQFNIIFATSGGVDANGCHNSLEGFHCHDSGNNTGTGFNLRNSWLENYIELSNSKKTGDIYNRIIKKLKEKRSCSSIYSEKERDYCSDILNEGDIYSKEEVLLELKKYKNCDYFFSLKSDKSECEYYIKTENIYTYENMKKDTYNFTSCSKIISFKKDYILCKQELVNKLEREEKEKLLAEKEKRLAEKQQILDNKFEKIKEVIGVIYQKNPRSIQKLQLQIFDILPKLKEGTMQQIIIKRLDEYLRIITWVDYRVK